MNISAGLRIAAALSSLAACGKVAPPPGDAGTTAAQACADLAQAECGKRDSCSKGTSITRVYGELSVCITRASLVCMNALGAPGTGASATTMSRCAAAYATLSCNDFFDGKPPPDCRPAGTIADGQPCVFAGQCQSGFCGRTRHALCGTCAPAPLAGDSCAESGCGHGQTCIDATMLCQDYGTLNAPCDPDAPCGNGLSCAGPGDSQTCEVALGETGLPCGGMMPGCNGTLGLACVGVAGAKSCAAISYVGDGMPCGNMGGTALALCRAGSCYTSAGVAGATEMGTCKLDAIEGASCDTAVGPGCMAPARCVVGSDGGTAGLCTLPTPTSCS